MEMASRSSRDFAAVEDDEFGRRYGSYQKVDLSVKVDRKNGGDQKQPSTPRSKHSATEQRRRSKINDRFQILRDLIPHSDQKRDKASFLLEVIEYIRFLHEKVQKYESCHEMPWPNLYASVGRGTGFTHPQKRLISDSNNMASQSQEQWQGPQCPLDCIVNSDMLDEQEELIVDEGTISVSNTYSQGLLAVLTQSLESSGLDLSQASFSVQISLGKHAKRPTLTGSSAKDRDDPSGNRAMAHSTVGSSGEESEQASKRHRSDVS